MMAASWTLAPALDTLRREYNQKFPKRSKSSDGTIGDTPHSKRKSEHNPDSKGVVRAIDLTGKGEQAQYLLDQVIGDPRVHYVIHNGKIYSRSNGWKPRKYTGQSPHTEHVHVSLRNRTSELASWAVVDRAANDRSSWFGTFSGSGSAAPGASIKPTPVVPAGKVSLSGLRNAVITDLKGPRRSTTNFSAVSQVQNALNEVFPDAKVEVDGYWGPATSRSYSRLQKNYVENILKKKPTKSDIDGLPGEGSLKWLADLTDNFEVVK